MSTTNITKLFFAITLQVIINKNIMILKESFTLLTFYKFVDVIDPKNEVEDHLRFCKDIWMKWRVYIWTEWISRIWAKLWIYFWGAHQLPKSVLRSPREKTDCYGWYFHRPKWEGRKRYYWRLLRGIQHPSQIRWPDGCVL